MASIISAGTTSGTALNLSGDTSGNLAFTTQAGANTITVPNVTGTMLTTASSGVVLQVTTGTDTTSYSTTTSTTTSTFSITLAKSTNKVAIYFVGTYDASIGSTVPGANIRLQRSGTTLSITSGFYVVTNNGGPPTTVSGTLPIVYLDAPGTTTPSYSILLNKASGGGTNTAYQSGGTWILMEIVV